MSQSFSKAIIEWYQSHKRDLPWRSIKDPYKIWLSEIILQQTRVAQGLPYYQKFVQQYPTVTQLAQAEEDDIMRLWQGLGYYSRARNLHAAARFVAQDLGGVFPDNYHDLLQLKGVGTYTAAAIASFAYDEAVAVLDGNVYRVIARYKGEDTDISSSQAKKVFSEHANALLDTERPSTYNQAIMEFGALLCTPLQPDCPSCPVKDDCEAFAKNAQLTLPIKTKKIKKKSRYFRYCIITQDDQVLVRKRDKKDIWASLYDFYLIEAHNCSALEKATEQDLFLQKNEKNLTLRKVSEVYKHILTHQILWIEFWHLQYDGSDSLSDLLGEDSFVLQPTSKLDQLPKPIMIANYLADNTTI